MAGIAVKKKKLKIAEQSYEELLQHPRWQKMRLDVFNRASFACEDCQAKELTLHVHHRIYIRGRRPWEYPIENFVCCCWQCHEKRELVVQQSRMIFQIVSPGMAKSFLDKLSAYRGDIDVKLLELITYLALDASVVPNA